MQIGKSCFGEKVAHLSTKKLSHLKTKKLNVLQNTDHWENNLSVFHISLKYSKIHCSILFISFKWP